MLVLMSSGLLTTFMAVATAGLVASSNGVFSVNAAFFVNRAPVRDSVSIGHT